MITNFLLGIKSYSKSANFFFHPNIFKYVVRTAIVSLALALLLGVILLYTGIKGIMDLTEIPENTPKLEVISRVISALLPFIIELVIVFTLYKNVVLTFCAPFLSSISSETEKLLRGEENAIESSWAQLLKEIWRGIRMALWATFQELIITLPLLLLNFIPVIGNIAAFVLIFLVQSYFSGANNLDFTLERRQHNVQESLTIIKKNKSLVTGSGFVFMLIMYIPLIGFIIAPALSVISATILYVEELQ
jgi:CysZ protein